MLHKTQSNDPKTLRVQKNGRSSSSNSYNSYSTAPVKSLSEVKNPSLLISFRFVNRGVTRLDEIEKFRNLTELDVTGNLLQQEVPEL